MVRTRVRSIDIARGIAMIAIVLGHLGNRQINRVVFTFHVPIFFLISGYCTRVDGVGLTAFIRKKARTLLVPYAVCCAGIVLIAALMAKAGGENVRAAIKQWLLAGAYGSGNSYTEPFPIPQIGAIWFLWAMFWGSLILRLTLPLKPLWRWAAILAAFLAGLITARRLFWFPLSVQTGGCAALYMALGCDLRRYGGALRRLPKAARIAGIALAFAAWALFIRNFRSFWLVRLDLGRGAIDIVGSLCACGCVMLIARWLDRHAGPPAALLARLGRDSILMLWVHITELNLLPWGSLIAAVNAAGFPAGLDYPLYIALKLILNIGGALILSKIQPVRRLFGLPADEVRH